MSTTYNVIAGDTYNSISRKVYGVETGADRIKRANPGAGDPPEVGSTLVVPANPSAPLDGALAAPSSSVNEVSLLVGGERFRFWSSVRIVRAIDSISTMEFTAPFDPDDPDQRDTFRPFSYPSASFTVGADRLFTGTLLPMHPSLSSNSVVLDVAGYSTPGVLADCNRPVDDPLEFTGLTLEDIARSVCDTFGLTAVFEAEPGAVFDKDPTCAQDKKALTFLADLAAQRNLVVGDSPEGELVFRQSAAAGIPRARLVQGNSPLLAVEPFHNPRQYYSSITGIEPVVVGASGSQFTVKNAALTSILRPHTFTVADAVGGDVKAAVNANAGRMIANAASYSVSVATWRDEQGRLWEPNTTVNLVAPGAMVYNEYSFIVRGVIFERTPESETATLDLIIPGSLAGELPEVLPWDE